MIEMCSVYQVDQLSNTENMSNFLTGLNHYEATDDLNFYSALEKCKGKMRTNLVDIRKKENRVAIKKFLAWIYNRLGRERDDETVLPSDDMMALAEVCLIELFLDKQTLTLHLSLGSAHYRKM